MSLWKDQLRRERIQRNWRQQDLADQLGTTVVSVQRWERGSHYPSAYFRVKLCALFGKSAEELGFASAQVLSPHPLEETEGCPQKRHLLPMCMGRRFLSHQALLLKVHVWLRRLRGTDGRMKVRNGMPVCRIFRILWCHPSRMTRRAPKRNRITAIEACCWLACAGIIRKI